MCKGRTCLTALVLVLGVVLAGTVWAADPSLVAWWKFDDGFGTTAIDSSGNGLDVSLHNTTWEDGVFGGALRFQRVGYGYVENFYHSDNAITVCAWVRHDAFRIGEIERYVTVAEEVAVIRKDLDGSLHFYIKTDGKLRHLLVGDVLREGRWHHVTGTWDGVTQRLYIDGVEIASQVLSGVLGNTLHVEMSSGGEPFSGMLDDVRIYNRALTQEEVQIIMQGGAGEYLQAWGQHRAAYYDERYRTSWATMPVPELVRGAFEDVGYEILDADQLKMWMDARIADGGQSVVVFCRDNAPDTVVESNSPDCTLRKYLDAGGKVVFYGDIPFWDVGHSDGTSEDYGGDGCANILGIPGVDWTNDTGTQVTITAEGTKWGLTETWTSNRWTPAGRTTTVLATDASGNAAAWVKHFVPGDTVGGFVRIWDCFVFEWNLPNVADLIRVAEYGMPGNPYARCPKPADGAVHALRWARMSWYPGDFALSHDVYFGESLDGVYDGAAEVFQGNQTSAHFGVGLPEFPYPYGLVPGTTYYWRIDEVNDLHPDSPWIGEVWSFSVPSETASTARQFEITYYDNYNYDTGRWDAWQSAATPRDAWDDKYLANGLSGNTVFTDHAFTSIETFDLRGNLFSKDGHASDGEDWNPLQSIGDTVSGQSAHHVFAALFEGLAYLEEGDVLAVASDDDVYVFLDGATRWGQEVLSVPAVSFFDTDSMIVTAAQAGYHMMTVRFIERLNDHSGIEITLNGEPLRSAEIEHLVTVPGTACVFFAGQDPARLAAEYPRDRVGPGDHDNFHHDATLEANTMPPSIEVSSGATLSLSASGVWGHCPGCTSGPDGVDFYDDTHDEYVTVGGISRVIAPLNTLVGVFLTDESPDPRARPMSLFPGADMTTPELQQAFAIGSGLEYVTVPEGATRLFFGHNDGYCWNDNVGSVEVAVVFDPPIDSGPPDDRTASEGFDLYLDYVAPDIVSFSLFGTGVLDYYCQDNPAAGDFCIHWTGADHYDNISFRFSPVKDLSMLVDEGYVVDFWVRCDTPSARFHIGFVDTKTNDPGDRPWFMRYAIDRNVADWNGQWNHLQIPLNAFFENGSWDDNRHWEPVGDFDWAATEYFQIIAEDSDLEGIHLYFDDIRVVASSLTRRRR